MRFVQRIAAGLAAVGMLYLSAPGLGMAQNGSVIRGDVRDSGGTPVSGALVAIVSASTPMTAERPERMVITDRRGTFSIDNLAAGEYSVRVTMPRFLPLLKNGVRINNGDTANLSLSMRTAMDGSNRSGTQDSNSGTSLNGGEAVSLSLNTRTAMDAPSRTATGESRDVKESEDAIPWILRSSRSTQPALRFESVDLSEAVLAASVWPTYSGFLEVYSTSLETSSGSIEGVGSRFSVTMPMPADAKVTVTGQYSESPVQPRGIAALYEFAPTDRRQSSVGFNARQGMMLGDTLPEDELKELQLQYSGRFRWSDHLTFGYGAQAGRAEGKTVDNYIRPEASLTWVPQRRTTVDIAATAQAPQLSADPLRGSEYFERVYLPPSLENYLHTEIGVSRLISDDMKLSVAIFRDEMEHHALLLSMPDGRRGLLIFDGEALPSQGFRIHLDRQFHGFDAGLGYTTATGIGISDLVEESDHIVDAMVPQNFHVVTVRFRKTLDLTNTEVTAVYRWVSQFSATPLDPYQTLVEYNDPTLSITVAQNLPTWRTFPGQVQAVLDARNLFEASVGTADDTQVTQSPRFVKGGINIRF